MLTFFAAYLLCGIFIGFVAGLLGIGGGVIGIPALLALFNLQGMPQDVAMHMAIGTSLAIVVVTSLASAFAHYRKGMILIPVFKRIILGAVLGCIFGIMIATHLKSIYLQYIFGIFLLIMAIQMLWQRKIKPRSELPNRKVLFAIATIFGAISGLLGLGGGMIMVPYFNWYGIPIREAVATAAACILPVAIIGTLGYMVADIQTTNLPSLNSGFIYWPAFIGISLTSALSAPIGARCTHTIPTTLLKKIFSLLLVVVGVSMLLN